MKINIARINRQSFNARIGFGSVCLVALVLLASQAQAAPSATFSNFVYSGSGCPSGSATATIQTTPGNAFIVDFSQFNIPFNSPPANQAKSCTLSVNITPSKGYKVSAQPALYQGEVGKQTIGNLSAGHQFDTFSTPLFTETYKGPLKFVKMHSGAVPYSKCATTAVLKDNIQLKVGVGDPANGLLRKATYTLQFQPC